MNALFRNAMFLAVIVEVIAGLMGWVVLLDISIIALATTAALWVVYLTCLTGRRRKK